MLAWAIKHWDKGLYIETVRRTRAESIAAFKEQFGVDDKTWKDDRKATVHRAVRVDVSIWAGH